MTPRRVLFFANGPARLLMSCLIAAEIHPDAERHLILLEQYGYRYDALLPAARQLFASVERLRVATRRYSHLDQLLHVYLDPFPLLRRAVTPGMEVVLFGIRSPAQKCLVRRARAVGATVKVWAEGMAVDRVFAPRQDVPWRRLLRRIFARAFEYQHDYDTFYVFRRDMYRDHPAFSRLADMPPLFTSPSARRLAERLTGELSGDVLDHDEVFFGQPLSDRDGVLARDEEEAMLEEIIGERRVLVLPHPNEAVCRPGTTGSGKYAALPNARVYAGPVPNDLLLLRLAPRRTSTWASTIGLTYAASRPGSENRFFPVDRPRLRALQRYQPFLPNMIIDERFVDRGRV